MSKIHTQPAVPAAGGAEDPSENYRKKRTRLIVICCVLFVAIVLLAIRTSWFHPPKTILTPDYPVVDEDPNRKPTEDNLTPVESGQGGGSVTLNYSDKVSYSLSTGEIKLQFANPGSSNHALIIQLIVYGDVDAQGKAQEYLLAESGVLKPGYQVERLDPDLDSNIVLSQGVYKGVMRLLFYNPDTGEKSIVNTEIPVDISVLS